MRRLAVVILLALVAGLAWMLAGPPDAPDVRERTGTAETPAPAPEPDEGVAEPEPEPEPEREPEKAETPEPGLPVEGVVVEDETGRPVVGARVVATPGGCLGNRSSVSMEDAFGERTTGADGRFAFGGLPRDRLLTITAYAPGFLPGGKTLELAPGAEAPTVELRLAPAASVRGVVTGPAGRPVEGAAVYAIPAGAPEMLVEDPRITVTGGGTWRAERGESGPDGAYEIDGLAPGGAYDVVAMAKGYARSRTSEGVRPRSGTPASADLRLREPGSAVLRVLSPDGMPVVDAHGWYRWLNWPHEVKADDDGVIRVDGLDPVEYTFRIDSARFLFQWVKVAVLEGETTEVEVRMLAGVTLAGVVVDDRGTPLASVEVEAQRPFHRKYRGLEKSYGKTVTDEEGRFRIEGLRPGTHGICAAADGHARRWTCPVEAPDEKLRVVVPRMARITGRLVPPEGGPPVGRVALKRHGGRRNEEMWGFPGGGSGTTTTEWPEGRLDTRVPDGTVRLEIRPEGYGPVRLELDLKPGETRDLGDIPLDQGLELRGRVVDPSGAPVAGARVFAGGAFNPIDSMTTGVDGGFVLRRLGEGEVEVEIEADGFLSRAVTGDTRRSAVPLVVTLHRGGVLRCTVIGEDGKPAAGLDVEIVERGKSEDEPFEEWVETDNRGAFEIRVPAGGYDLIARRDGEPLGRAAAKIEEGGGARVTITLGE
jgi:protocatechuate 3,4-dioxygenase beta subunit